MRVLGISLATLALCTAPGCVHEVAAGAPGPRNEKEAVRRGAQCLQNDDVDDAIRACTEVLDYESRSSSWWKPAEVTVTSLVPESRAQAYRARGKWYLGKDRVDDALSDFEAALRIERDDTEAINLRGFALSKKGEFDDAIRDHDRAIQLEPGLALAFLGRGFAHAGKGRFDRAIQDFSEAIRLDPKDARARAARGRVYCEQGNYRRANQDYRDAIRLNPAFAGQLAVPAGPGSCGLHAP
jgi:tetratricopeptide (TPR) repeat protein